MYTARQLRQLIERADGAFVPKEETWRAVRWPVGGSVTPIRRGRRLRERRAARSRSAEHLVAVRRMFERLDVFVFTLDSTEAWMSSVDGAVFPIAPGVLRGSFDSGRHVFVNFDFDDVIEDLETFHARLLQINPGGPRV